jgi:ribonucleoside-diphosphate reductase alpha chain
MAAILGTWQASLTDFQYISEKWKKNCEEERLLGVSLTGIMDNAFMSGMHIHDPQEEPKNKRARTENPWSGYTLPNFLTELKEVAVETNRIWSKKLGFNSSAAITTVKPSGTVSQLVDSASGIHTRHAKDYIRTVRGDKKDPMTKFLQDEGVPWEPCVTKPDDTVVFSFPIKAPDQCITRDDQTALQQLEICKIYGEYWCHHKVSVTITVKEPEWMQVGSWIWDNFDTTAGMSFLPHSEHTYRQAPYQECDEATYTAAAARMPKINWKKLRRYETSDMTSGAKELACSAGGCEI